MISSRPTSFSKKLSIISAGVIFSWAIQCISKINLSTHTLTEIFIEDYDRILLSGLVGGVLFYLLFVAFNKFCKEKSKSILISSLHYFHVFLLYILLQGGNHELFFSFLTLVILVVVIRFFYFNLFCVTNIWNFILPILIIGYFSVSVIAYEGQTSISLHLLTIFSLSYLSIPIFVLVIGESTDRNHMSIYDYHRPTNPKLEKIKNELFVFDDVISPHSHTIPVLNKVLTFANFEDMKPFFDEGTLIELFKQAGFKTYWLSNQYFIGAYESVISCIAKESDWYLFVNDENLNKEQSYDERMLTPFKKILEEKKKKFIVIHLLGTHRGYENRYPDKFNFFKTTDDIRVQDKPFLKESIWGKDRINEYDNAVRYNDSIIYEITEMIKIQNKYSYMIYFSDHGEEVYDCRAEISHEETNPTAFMFEIPFITWFSEDYKKHNKSKTDSLTFYLNRKYQTDDVIHSIIDISNLHLNRYEPSKSIFNPDFKEEKRIMNGQDYDEERKKYSTFAKILKKR